MWPAHPACWAGFIDESTASGVRDAGDSVGVAWGDYDNDGHDDLYVGNYGQANKLYQNPLGAASPTLLVKPLTAAGAPSIFAAVKLATADGTLVALRTLDGGSGFCSQNG